MLRIWLSERCITEHMLSGHAGCRQCSQKQALWYLKRDYWHSSRWAKALPKHWKLAKATQKTGSQSSSVDLVPNSIDANFEKITEGDAWSLTLKEPHCCPDVIPWIALNTSAALALGSQRGSVVQRCTLSVCKSSNNLSWKGLPIFSFTDSKIKIFTIIIYIYELFVTVAIIWMTLRFDLRTNRTFFGTGAHVHGNLSLISLKVTNGYYGGR